jgi:hypothetical protein
MVLSLRFRIGESLTDHALRGLRLRTTFSTIKDFYSDCGRSLGAALVLEISVRPPVKAMSGRPVCNPRIGHRRAFPILSNFAKLPRSPPSRVPRTARSPHLGGIELAIFNTARRAMGSLPASGRRLEPLNAEFVAPALEAHARNTRES